MCNIVKKSFCGSMFFFFFAFLSKAELNLPELQKKVLLQSIKSFQAENSGGIGQEEPLPAEREEAQEQESLKQHEDNSNEISSSEDKSSAQELTEKKEVLEQRTPPKAPESYQIKSVNTFVIHQFSGGITAIEVISDAGAFFVAGNDGFMTKYTYPSLKPDTWQISPISIKKIAVHPSGKYVAAYESDGFSVYKISLWEWGAKKRLFAKRLAYSVTSLSWSANGTYLFAGNRSLEGITIFDIKGVQHNIYEIPPGIVFMAATGPSEKSIVTYGETGRLVYIDIKTKKYLTEYKTENKLENPTLIKNFTRILGYKNNAIFVINALNGNILEKYQANSPIFASKLEDATPFWIEKAKAKNEWCICEGNITAKTFKLPDNNKITAARHIGKVIIIGTEGGNIYLLKKNGREVNISAPVEYKTSPIKNICTDGYSLFALVNGNIYTYKDPAMPPIKTASGINHDCLVKYEDGFLLWSDEKKMPIVYYSAEKDRQTVISRPKAPIISLNIFEDIVTFVEAFGAAVSINIKTGKKLFSYNSAGTQNALQIDKEHLLISKSASGTAQTPIFLLNMKTSETLPLKIEGELALMLTKNSNEKSGYYCLLISSEPNITELLSFGIDSSNKYVGTTASLLAYKDEDLDAFLGDCTDGVLTNLGKDSLILYKYHKDEAVKLHRDYALPKKAIRTENFIVSLNYDGSLSWYEKDSFKHIKTIQFYDN